MERADGQAVYVYGVVPGGAELDLPPAGIEGTRDARLVEDAGLAAIVADDPREPVPTTRRNLHAHTDVLARAAEQTTVLPMRFGVVFPDERRVRDELLRGRRDELASLLARHEGKVEVTVRGIYEDQDSVLREVVAAKPAIARLRDEVRKLPEAAGYYARIRLGELVAGALEERRLADERRVLDRLGRLASATERETELPERVVFKAAFLLERSRLGDFDRAVDDLARELAGRVRLVYAGPLALHSFVDLSDSARAVPA